MQKTFPKPKTNHHTTVKAMAQRRHGEPAQNATATNPQDQLPNTASAGENLHSPYKPTGHQGRCETSLSWHVGLQGILHTTIKAFIKALRLWMVGSSVVV